MKKVLVIAAVLLTQFSLEAQEDLRGTAEVDLEREESLHRVWTTLFAGP